MFPKPIGFPFPAVRTGCFGDGPGRINITTGELCFPNNNLEANKKYQFSVIASKSDGRSGRASVMVWTVAGATFRVNIRSVNDCY